MVFERQKLNKLDKFQSSCKNLKTKHLQSAQISLFLKSVLTKKISLVYIEQRPRTVTKKDISH